jgi:hypothetical protein
MSKTENKKYGNGFRPLIDNTDIIFELENRMKSSGTRIVNMLVETGGEVLKRTLDKFAEDFEKRIEKKLKGK